MCYVCVPAQGCDGTGLDSWLVSGLYWVLDNIGTVSVGQSVIVHMSVVSSLSASINAAGGLIPWGCVCVFVRGISCVCASGWVGWLVFQHKDHFVFVFVCVFMLYLVVPPVPPQSPPWTLRAWLSWSAQATMLMTHVITLPHPPPLPSLWRM